MYGLEVRAVSINSIGGGGSQYQSQLRTEIIEYRSPIDIANKLFCVANGEILATNIIFLFMLENCCHEQKGRLEPSPEPHTHTQ